jgi:hypothetical protein
MDPTIIVGIVVGVLLVGGGAFLLLRWRAQQQQARGEEYYHFRCPGCKRRLRFRARQSGNKGQCSHCRKDIVFPSPSQAID